MHAKLPAYARPIKSRVRIWFKVVPMRGRHPGAQFSYEIDESPTIFGKFPKTTRQSRATFSRTRKAKEMNDRMRGVIP